MATSLQRIALMTQWTEFDSAAERVALALAERGRLPLATIVPLYSNPELEVVAPALVAEGEAASARAAADFDTRVRAAGVSAELRVRRGDELWREVVDEAGAARADLIVTRRRGHRSFLGKLRVGEVVRAIAARAPCPLMMVPRAAALPVRGRFGRCDQRRGRAGSGAGHAVGLCAGGRSTRSAFGGGGGGLAAAR
jgi:nucleotide-binding universal stress UspA family protein